MATAAIKGIARLRVLSGQAQPSPTIGQALGPLGVNMVEFCKKFNEHTKKLTPGMPTPVMLTAFEDRTYDFKTKTPPTTWLLKQVSGVEKGTTAPGKELVGEVSSKQIYEIAKIKVQDEHLSDISLESLCKSIKATATSMGLKTV
jgi:large subunit ribosomal protein L11|tara:strand:- start:1108 stop:1542 length:435 start_codon:yes stop_codon:yes gene_type:complete